MDMTAMYSIADNSIDIVFDKGAIDALMSTDSIAIQLQAIKMFNEIQRILTSSGYYFCITLAESYILTAILEYFVDTESNSLECCYVTSINTLPLLDDKANLNELLFIPFCVVIQKVKGNKNLVRMHIDPLCNKLVQPMEVDSCSNILNMVCIIVYIHVYMPFTHTNYIYIYM